MDPVSTSALINGYVGQWLKAHPKVPAWAIDVIQLSGGAIAYLLTKPPVGDYDYIRDCVLFAFANLGISSFSGHTNMAPKTT